MSNSSILTIDNHLTSLRNKCETINQLEWKSLKSLVEIMKRAVKETDGVGIAAPQIGCFKNMFLFKTSKNHFELAINPVILSYSKELITIEERCLSCPNVLVKVPRSKYITVSYKNSLWQQKNKKLRDISAIIFQHEFEHLQGKLIIDYLDNYINGESK